MLQHELGPALPQRMDQGAVVSKPNVTTGRTANASRIRRKQEANFMCPVPGCGSTFTRSFNLKGKCFFVFFFPSSELNLWGSWGLGLAFRSYALA